MKNTNLNNNRIHLNEEDFILPKFIAWQHDQNIELTVTLRNLRMTRKVMKQILSDQNTIIDLLNSTNLIGENK